MINRLPPQLLTALRTRFLTGDDARLSLHLGNYLQWFGIAEVNVTTMLAFILNLTQWEQLEYVVRGMDARVKCERLRQAAKAYRPLGDNVKASLSVFEQKCIPLRNRAAHSWPFLDAKTDIISFATFGRMPDRAEDGRWEFDPSTRQIHIDDLFSQAMWLNSFANDFSRALQRATDGGPLEVDDPKSRLPQGVIEGTLPHKDGSANSDMPDQKPPENQGK